MLRWVGLVSASGSDAGGLLDAVLPPVCLDLKMRSLLQILALGMSEMSFLMGARVGGLIGLICPLNYIVCSTFSL